MSAAPFPLNTHEHAVLAACAAEAAANQGKFWQMAEALYKTQWMWASAPAPRTIFMDQAKNLGLDLDQSKRTWTVLSVASGLTRTGLTD